jgi:hypothetical protein
MRGPVLFWYSPPRPSQVDGEFRDRPPAESLIPSSFQAQAPRIANSSSHTTCRRVHSSPSGEEMKENEALDGYTTHCAILHPNTFNQGGRVDPASLPASRASPAKCFPEVRKWQKFQGAHKLSTILRSAYFLHTSILDSALIVAV